MSLKKPLSSLVLLSAVLLAACSPIRMLDLLVPQTSRPLLDLAYGDHPRQRLDVYRPTGAPPPGGFPLVVFFYGGSWNNGERGQFRFVGEALASRGIVALVADYRLYPEVRYPDFLHDSAAAVAFALRRAEEFGGDPARVFVMGHSAGAYNAAMVALDRRWLGVQRLDPERLAGWIGLAGPYDFLPIGNPAVRPVFHHPDYPPGSQPIDLVHRGAPPALLIAARDDDSVDPRRNSVAMAGRLNAHRVPATLVVMHSGVGHATLAASLAWPLRWLAPVLDEVAAFVAGAPPRPAGAARSGAR